MARRSIGSIQKIRDDYWRISLRVGKDPLTGKYRRITQYVRGTKRQAEDALNDLIAQVKGGKIPGAAARYTVADLLDEWYREMQHEWAPQSRRTRDVDIRHIKALIGHVRLRDLDALTIKRMIDKMREQGYAPRTINGRLTALRGAITRAIELGLIKHDPFVGVRRPKAPPRQMQVLNEDQLIAVLTEARRDGRWGLAILLAARTGLRRGEVLALKWEDLDWQTGELQVRRTVIYGEGGGARIQDHPKTPSSVRIVVLDEYLLNLLRQHRRRQAEERLRKGPTWQDHGLIFPAEDGHPAHPGRIYEAIVRIRKRVGIPWLRLHDLRHAHASHLLAAGWSPVDVAERLGHAKPSITMALYAHALPGRQRELVQRLGLGGTKVAPFGDIEGGEIKE